MTFEYRPLSEFKSKNEWVKYLYTLGAGKGVTEALIYSRLNRWKSVEKCVTLKVVTRPSSSHVYKKHFSINYR